MLDILIKNGRIIDGTGKAACMGEVGIKDGKIQFVAEHGGETAAKVVDADGLTVAPGFIDMHTHTELCYYEHPDACFKISQGVTTELGGQCAISPAPVTDRTVEEIRAVNNPLCGLGDLEYSWRSMQEFFEAMDKRPHITNLATLVGHNAIRSIAMGFEDREPTSKELDVMKAELARALSAGAFGLSAAGVQSPSNFGKTEELSALVGVVASQNALFEMHLRSESNQLLHSVAEMIRIAEETGCRTQISHFKVAGRHNFGKAKAAIAMMREARESGLDIACNQYPYTYASFNLEALMPLWARSGSYQEICARIALPEARDRIETDMKNGVPGSGWESVWQWCGYEGITVGTLRQQQNQAYSGKNLHEIAKLSGKREIDVVCDLIMEEGLGVIMFPEFGNEEETEEILQLPWCAPVTDALATHLSGSMNHPRIFGTFPKVLGHYTRDRDLMSLEEAVYKMTALPAQRIGLGDRGTLASGKWADIVIFNPDTVRDTADMQDPTALSEGISKVFVNGVLSYDGDRKTVTGDLSGVFLRRQ